LARFLGDVGISGGGAPVNPPPPRYATVTIDLYSEEPFSQTSQGVF